MVVALPQRKCHGEAGMAYLRRLLPQKFTVGKLFVG
jgi:hypothetical protein